MDDIVNVVALVIVIWLVVHHLERFQRKYLSRR